MARGSKESYTPKQKRQARHIEESEKKSGRGEKAAARIAWATVNKLTGGAGKSTKKSASSSSSSKKSKSKSGRSRRKQTVH